MQVPDYVVVIVALVAYQIMVTVMVVRSPYFAERQKRSQLLTIWLIPFVGAMLVRMAHNIAKSEAMAANAQPAAPPAAADPGDKTG